METAFSFSSKLVVSSTNIVKFFVPRIFYDPRVVIFKSARIARYFIPQRILNLGEKCVEFIGILSTLQSLLEQVQQLEQQIRTLKEWSVQNEEKYSKANLELHELIMSLKQQIEDLGWKNDEKSQQEYERLKDIMEQIRREQRKISENASIKILSCEVNNANLEMIVSKIEADQKRLMKEVKDLTQGVIAAKRAACDFKEQEKRFIEDNEVKAKMIDGLLFEMERLKLEMKKYLSDTTLDDSLKLKELYTELCRLKEKNFILEEANDDLKSSLLLAGLEQGQLLTCMKRVTADLDSMTKEEVQKALKEEQHCNSKLKIYIDRILIKIVETYPQLLEVKQKTKTRLSK